MASASETIILNGARVDLADPVGVEFICDCTRAGEGLLTDADLLDRYNLTAKGLAKLSKHKELAKAVKREAERRVRLGLLARERAARHYATTPEILGSIANNADASPMHRISACKEIRETATTGNDARSAASGSTFLIRIDLSQGGGEIEDYEKVIVPRLPASEGEDYEPW
jgi:hypothetical protein